MSKRKVGSGHGAGSKATQFKPGQSGNREGRPKKQPSTFESEVKAVLNKMVPIKTDDGYVEISKRQLLIERIVNLGIQGSATMARLALPLLKIADEHPQLTVLPEDEAILRDLMAQFNAEGE